MNLRFKSIRWQMQVWYGLLLLAIITAFSLIAHQMRWLHMLQNVDNEIRQKNTLIISDLRRSAITEPRLRSIFQVMRSDHKDAIFDIVMERLQRGEIKISENTLTNFSGREPGFAYFKIFDSEGNTISSSNNIPNRIEPTPIPTEGVEISSRTVGNQREQAVAQKSGIRLIIGQDLAPEKKEMQAFTYRIAAGAGVTWFVALLGGWLVAGYVLRPIKTISEAAVRVSRENLKERIPLTSSGNELHDLAIVLNETFRRLDEAFERQQQFTADASHELRTPVTIILSETQRIKKKKACSEDEYKEAIDVCHTAGQRMKKLVENLLLLARHDSNNHNLHLETIQLDRLIGDYVDANRIIAKEKLIEIHSFLDPVSLETDVLKFSTLINNIVGNAVSHHTGCGNVWVTMKKQGRDTIISVRDDGPGIGEGDLPHIFERFYQADKSRSSNQSNSGLGLAVSKSIADDLGGRIEVKSELGKGSEFIITFN